MADGPPVSHPTDDPGGEPNWALVDTYLRLSPDAAIAVDSTGRIRVANDLAADLFRCPVDALTDHGIEALMPQRYRDVHTTHRSDYHDHPRQRRMGAGLDLWGVRADGTEFPVDVSLSPIGDPPGQIVIAAIRDMTERRREQAAQAQLAAIVDSTGDAIVATSVDGTIVTWNPGAVELLGYQPDEIVGRHVDVLVPDELRAGLDEVRQRVMRGEPVAPFETLRRRRDGVDIDLEVTLSIVRDRFDQVIGTAGIFRDISDRIRARSDRAIALQQRAELAQLADRERIARDLHDVVIQRIFAAGMTVQAATRMLSKAPDVKKRLNNVVDDLDATIVELRSTIFDLEHHRVEAASLRAEIVDLVEELRLALGHDPVVQFDGPVDTAVPSELAQHALAVVREALTNIARHAAASATRVEVTATETLRIRVRDNGVGVGSATGFSGLRNLRDRAEQLGGRFTLHSPAHGGTELVWQVPIR